MFQPSASPRTPSFLPDPALLLLHQTFWAGNGPSLLPMVMAMCAKWLPAAHTAYFQKLLYNSVTVPTQFYIELDPDLFTFDSGITSFTLSE